MRTEVTVEPDFSCPNCGRRALLRDTQMPLFAGAPEWWCEFCKAHFQFELLGFGLPAGGFRLVPEGGKE